MNLVQIVGFCKVVDGCTFDSHSAYLVFCRTVKLDWNNCGNIGWFGCGADDGEFSHCLDRGVQRRSRFLNDEVILIFND